MGLFHHCTFWTTKHTQELLLRKVHPVQTVGNLCTFDRSLQRVKFNRITVIKYQITWLGTEIPKTARLRRSAVGLFI